MQPAHYYLMEYTVFSLSSSSSFSLVERHTTHWHMSRCYELDSHSFDGSISMFLRWPLCMWHVTAKHFIMLLFGWLSEPKRIDWLTTNFFSRQNNQLNISIKAMNEKPFDEATVRCWALSQTPRMGEPTDTFMPMFEGTLLALLGRAFKTLHKLYTQIRQSMFACDNVKMKIRSFRSNSSHFLCCIFSLLHAPFMIRIREWPSCMCTLNEIFL